MGQKIHPTGFRLAVTRNWGSRWYAGNSNFASMLLEDLAVRDFLKKKLKNASVGRVLIERPAKNARITIFSSRPGVVIGKKGEDIEVLKSALAKMMGVPVHVNIEEIRKPETDAQLIADSIAQQLEKRIMFRRAMKRAMQNAMRLGGIKVWVYKGDRLANGETPVVEVAGDDKRERRAPRRDDGKPAARPARTKRPEGSSPVGVAATAGDAATAAKRVRAKKADAPAAPAEKAGE
jgi:small subunit ribosomal protein S3